MHNFIVNLICPAQSRETCASVSVVGGADRDADHERDSDDRGQREPSTNAVRALLLLGTDRSIDVRRMNSALVAAVRGVVDARARDADGAADAARTIVRWAPRTPTVRLGPDLERLTERPGKIWRRR